MISFFPNVEVNACLELLIILAYLILVSKSITFILFATIAAGTLMNLE